LKVSQSAGVAVELNLAAAIPARLITRARGAGQIEQELLSNDFAIPLKTRFLPRAPAFSAWASYVLAFALNFVGTCY
jgi:hypothetical protein